jgi:nucleoside-diphosphate-sugar epimerase
MPHQHTPHQVSSRIRPIDIYGQTKKEAEKEIQLNSKTFGTKYTILRPF